MYFVALIALIGGFILLLGSRKDMRRRRKILSTKATTIAAAPGSGTVEIQGAIVTGEEGTVLAPISGREVVYFRLIVSEQRSSGRNSHWVDIIKDEGCRSFYVDDGSGQTARVFPDLAHVILDREKVAQCGTLRNAPLELEELLRENGHSSTGLLGLNKTIIAYEEVLLPGQPIFAIGPARREGGPPVQDASYRSTPTTRLVLRPGEELEDELLLSSKSGKQLVNRLLGSFAGGVALMVIGGGMLAFEALR
jgi:hypothetical protein